MHTSEKNTIGFALTKKDTDLIEWLNMLQDNCMEPATWVQAALLAELAGQDLEIGGVYVPPPKKKPASTRLFGDDTTSKELAPSYGWNVRGVDGAFIPGSVYTINITRPIVLFAIENCLSGRLMMSRYLRAILRKRIRHLSQPPNELPKVQDIEDIFILYEGFFPGFDPRKPFAGRKLSKNSRVSPSRPAREMKSSAQTEVPGSVEAIRPTDAFGQGKAPALGRASIRAEGPGLDAKGDGRGDVEGTKNPLLAFIT